MDQRQHSPASLCESELDETCSTASSPMSVSSVEASSPYHDGSSRLSGDEDVALNTQDSSFFGCGGSSVALSPGSPPSSPAAEESSIISDDLTGSVSNPYYTWSRSVRWYRDDRGLWSDRSASRCRTSPYVRCSAPSRQQHHHDANMNSLNISNANANSRKSASEVLLDAVLRQDQAQLRHLLAKSAAHVNVLGEEGDSPLHRSCRLGNLDAVKLLVRYGADPDLTNREGWSPLHLAVHSGYQDVVVYLLSLARRR